MNALNLAEFRLGLFLSSLSEQPLVERLGWTLLHSVWQLALVAMLLWLFQRLLTRRSAESRYLAACIAMLSTMLLCVATFSLLELPRHDAMADGGSPRSNSESSGRDAPLLVADGSGSRLAETADGPGGLVDADGSGTDPARAAAGTAPRPSRGSAGWYSRLGTTVEPWLATIVAIWLSGVVVLSTRPLIGWYSVRQLRRRGTSAVPSQVVELLRRTAARLGLKRAISVVQSTLVEVPAVIGHLRPLVLLPASAITCLSPAQLEALLAHELAHIRRYDCLVNLLQTAVETLLFYHPAVWWVSRHIRVQRELCCDDLASTLCRDRTTYADALLAVHELRAAGPRLALSADGASLLARVRRLAGHSSPQAGPPTFWTAGLVVAILLLAAGFAALLSAANVATDPARLVAAAEERADPKPTDHELPSTARTIDCTVSGPDGPMESATVKVTFSVSGEKDRAATNLDVGKTLRETVHTTDARGRYQIKVPAGLADRPALRLAVTVEHPDHLRRSIGPLPVSDFEMQRIANDEAYWMHRQMARQSIIRTRLRKGRRLAGRVLLPDGSPAVGAEVFTRTKYQPYSWKFHDPDDYTFSDNTTTDEDGRFSLVVDQRAILTVDVPGHAPLVVDDLQKRVADPPNTFRLPRGFRTHGRVLTGDGKPIPGAIIIARRDFEWNEFDMPVAFGRSCAADENGEYELPPLPAGAYRFRVNSRIGDPSRIPEYNEAGSRTERPEIPTEALSDVILDVTKELADLDQSPRLDFRAVETVTVTARVEFPHGERPPDGRTVDLTVVGRMNGQRWSGISATADDAGIARLIVPQRVEDVVIGTGLARHRRTPDGPVEIGEAIHLGAVTNDVSGLVVIRPRLAKLKVKLELPDALSRQCARMKAHVHINAWHTKTGYLERPADRQRVWLDAAMQTNNDQYRGTALPDEEIVLRVTKSVGAERTVLHEERLTLTPGEERLRTIAIADR